MKQVIIKTKKADPIRRFHPWVFSGAIAVEKDNPEDGDRVQIVTSKGEILGVGHYQDGSIRVRIIHFGAEDIPQNLWQKKIESAYQLRKKIGLAGSKSTTCYRLIHAEGDGCPGLVIDVYGGTAVIQCHSIGMYKEQQAIAAAIQQILGLPNVYSKSKKTLPGRPDLFPEDDYLIGDLSKGIVKENDHSFLVDWKAGQKTGFFLDQRDNRALLAKFAKDKTVLNTFCYSGGFSIYALKAGARQVTSIDASKGAIALCDQNVSLNGFDEIKHKSIVGDVMKYFTNEEKNFDIVVTDPPAFAKNLRKRHQAVQGYKRLNAMAIKRVKPGGLLFAFSCSQVVDQALFRNTLVAAGLESGRQLQVLHQLSQGADHPVHLYHPEGSYLKGLVLRVI